MSFNSTKSNWDCIAGCGRGRKQRVSIPPSPIEIDYPGLRDCFHNKFQFHQVQLRSSSNTALKSNWSRFNSTKSNWDIRWKLWCLQPSLRFNSTKSNWDYVRRCGRPLSNYVSIPPSPIEIAKQRFAYLLISCFNSTKSNWDCSSPMGIP